VQYLARSVTVALASLLAFILPNPCAHSADFRSIHYYHNSYVLILHGPIIAGDAARFQQLAVSELRAGHALVALRAYSPGGSTDEAVNIGRQVRMLKLYTFGPVKDPQGKSICNYSDIDHFTMQSGHYGSDCICASACSLIWMGGAGRDGDAVIGIHAPRYDEMSFSKFSPDQADEQYKEVVALLKGYFNELGDVPTWTLQKMLSSDSSHMHYLDAQEIAEFYNFNPALEELVLARCGKIPGGNLWVDSARKRFFDCDQPILEQAAANVQRNYLATYGN
jgi:hypothetical protein